MRQETREEHAKEQERLRRIADARSLVGRAKDLLEVAQTTFPEEMEAAESALIDAESRFELAGNYRAQLRREAGEVWKQASDLRVAAVRGDDGARERSNALLIRHREILDEIRAEEDAAPLAALAVLEEHADTLRHAADLFDRGMHAEREKRDRAQAEVDALAAKLRAAKETARRHDEAAAGLLTKKSEIEAVVQAIGREVAEKAAVTV